MYSPLIPRALRCSRLAVASYFAPTTPSAVCLIQRSSPFHRNASTLVSPESLEVPQKWNSPLPHHRLAQKTAAKLTSFVDGWRNSRTVQDRLYRFGIGYKEVHLLTDAFVSDLKAGTAWSFADERHEVLSRMWEDLSHPNGEVSERAADQNLTSIFYRWATAPERRSEMHKLAPPSMIDRMARIAEVTDLRHLAQRFPLARSIRRKVIMHVGPTNSGKTHNALRALAAAEVGVYMGPLRLLAYEIYERLNAGQIIPLGADPENDPHVVPDALEQDESSNFDVAAPGRAVFRRQGDPRYVRKCALMTGEERRETPGATTAACTAEMASITQVYDVAVLDEIQLLADRDRGQAWTVSVLGTPAHELHLCGEETAVPLVRAMLEGTHDELIVHRYERLSPLRIADESLKGDIKNVQKGDCVVAFARSSIFAFKARIERETGLRCAVAYGRLPPDVRSEQAALFNDPKSNYDVIVASDAVGMGLNLKIRRVVFSQISKPSTFKRLEPVSISQMKQIGGRAGRFGLHGADDSDAGVVTTLFEEHLHYAQQAFQESIPPVPHAYVGVFGYSLFFEPLISMLPSGSSSVTVHEAFHFVSRLPHWAMTSGGHQGAVSQLQLVDSWTQGEKVRDREVFALLPFNMRDEELTVAVKDMLLQHTEAGRVEIVQIMTKFGYLDYLALTIQARDTGKRMAPQWEEVALRKLETLYKILVVYRWAHYHWPTSFYAYNTSDVTTKAAEKAMEYLLDVISQSRRKNQSGGPSKKGERGGNRGRAQSYTQFRTRQSSEGFGKRATAGRG